MKKWSVRSGQWVVHQNEVAAPGSETGILHYYPLSTDHCPLLVTTFCPLTEPMSWLMFSPCRTRFGRVSAAFFFERLDHEQYRRRQYDRLCHDAWAKLSNHPSIHG